MERFEISPNRSGGKAWRTTWLSFDLKRIEKLYRGKSNAERVVDEKRLSRAREEYNNAFNKLSLFREDPQSVVEVPVATGPTGEGPRAN
jgi:hypothetical protein